MSSKKTNMFLLIVKLYPLDLRCRHLWIFSFNVINSTLWELAQLKTSWPAQMKNRTSQKPVHSTPHKHGAFLRQRGLLMNTQDNSVCGKLADPSTPPFIIVGWTKLLSHSIIFTKIMLFFRECVSLIDVPHDTCYC